MSVLMTAKQKQALDLWGAGPISEESATFCREAAFRAGLNPLQSFKDMTDNDADKWIAIIRQWQSGQQVAE